MSFAECTLDGYDYIPNIYWCVKLYYNVSKTWVGANEICQNDGGNLVSITTLEKWNFLSNYLNCKWTIFSFNSIKTYISNLVRAIRIWNNLHQIRSKPKVWKAK